MIALGIAGELILWSIHRPTHPSLSIYPSIHPVTHSPPTQGEPLPPFHPIVHPPARPSIHSSRYIPWTWYPAFSLLIPVVSHQHSTWVIPTNCCTLWILMVRVEKLPAQKHNWRGLYNKSSRSDFFAMFEVAQNLLKFGMLIFCCVDTFNCMMYLPFWGELSNTLA